MQPISVYLNKLFCELNTNHPTFYRRFAFPRSLQVFSTLTRSTFRPFPFLAAHPPTDSLAYAHPRTPTHLHTHTIVTTTSILALRQTVHIHPAFYRRSYYYPFKQKAGDTFCQGSCHPSQFNFATLSKTPQTPLPNSNSLCPQKLIFSKHSPTQTPHKQLQSVFHYSSSQ